MTRLASPVLVVRSLERVLAVYEQALGFARVGEPSDVPSLGARHVFLRAENCLHDPAKARAHLAHASVQTPSAAERWYVRPADAHGMLVEVTAAAAPAA